MVARNPLAALRSSPGGARLLDAMAATGVRAYVVGGAVRDLLLGRTPRELDVVVEGEVDELAAALGGSVVAHDRFGTATVTVEDGTYDLAQARAEAYPSPGELPEVRPAPLREDLLRRDVTVNAIALAPDGELIAVDGAIEDLQEGVLRVLHDASFRDDPTRLWRLARYAARLDFTVEPHTAELARVAVRSGALATVSGARIGNEVRLALREPDPHGVLRAAAALDLLPAGMADPGPLAARAAALMPPEGRPELLVLAAWACDMGPADLRAWLDDLAFPAADRAVTLAAASAPHRLTFPDRPSELAYAMRGEPVEAVALAGAAGDARSARRWLEDLRGVTLDIDGDDVLAAGVAPGPGVGAALRRALDARLDGEAPDRESQLRSALDA